MTISIHSVQDPDLQTISEMMTAYKISTSINRLLWKTWPNETVQMEQVLGSIRHSFEDPATEMFKAVDEDANGEIVGFLALTRKMPAAPVGEVEAEGGAEEKEEGRVVMQVPDRFNANVFTAVIEAMGDIGREAEGFDRFEITAFVVRQDRYRQGIGSRLMSEVFDRARAEKIPVVTHSEPPSHAFFKKLGFRETKVVDLDLAAWTDPFSGYGLFRLAGMVWDP